VPLSEVYNEHRIFLPYVGLAAAAVWLVVLGLTRIGRPRVASVVGLLLLVGVVAAHGIGTHRRNAVWKNEETLWEDVTIKSPRNGRGLMNYGLTLMRDGHVREALDYFERAATITPNYSILEINLAIAKSTLGEPEQAESHFRRALDLTPDYARGHFYYARWLVDHQRAPEAIAHLERAVAVSPGDVDANRLLLEIHAATGNAEGLVARARRVLEIVPEDPTATAYASGSVPYEVDEESAEAYASLGLQRINAKEWLESATLYRQALRLDPNESSSWNNLGWALLSVGFLDLAVPCFERALELDPDSELARGNRNWALELQSAAPGSPDASP
jgi:tetratricopeptide (TPR) repeat protein